MGGRSRSSQSTQSTQQSTNLVNEGEFAGASDIVIDESDRSVEESFNTDSSTTIEDSGNTETEIDESFNTDNSVRDAFNTQTEVDSSVRDAFNQTTEIDQEFIDERDQSTRDSFNTDNSVEIDNDGDFAGNSGVINLLDGGAIATAESVGLQSLATAENVAEIVTNGAGNQLNESLGAVTAFGAGVIDEVINGAGAANQTVAEVAQAISENSLRTVSNVAVDSLDEVNQAVDSAFGLAGDVVAELNQNNSEIIAASSQTINTFTEAVNDNLNDSLAFAGEVAEGLRQNSDSAIAASVEQNQILSDAVNRNLVDSLSFAEGVVSDVTGDLRQISDSAITSSLAQNDLFTEAVNANLNDSLNFAGLALTEFGEQGAQVINANTGLTEVVIDALGQEALAFRDSLTSQSAEFATSVAQLAANSAQSNQAVLQALGESNAEGQAIIAELAATTSTGGQTVIAESAQNIVMFVAIGLGVLGVGFALSRVK